MTTKAKEYLEEHDSRRVMFVVDYGTIIRGICEIVDKFVRIHNKSQFKDLGGYATFGRDEILDDSTMTMEEFNRG